MAFVISFMQTDAIVNFNTTICNLNLCFC